MLTVLAVLVAAGRAEAAPAASPAHPRPLVVLDAGHGGSSGRYDALKERAESLAFMLVQWGLTDPAPLPG